MADNEPDSGRDGDSPLDPASQLRDTQASTTAAPATNPAPGPVIYLITTPPRPTGTRATTTNRGARRRTRVPPGNVIDLDAFNAQLPDADDDLGELDDLAPPMMAAPTPVNGPVAHDDDNIMDTATPAPMPALPTPRSRASTNRQRARTGTTAGSGWTDDEEIVLAEVRRDLDALIRGMRGIQGFVNATHHPSSHMAGPPQTRKDLQLPSLYIAHTLDALYPFDILTSLIVHALYPTQIILLRVAHQRQSMRRRLHPRGIVLPPVFAGCECRSPLLQ
ncbi:unnamed protein product [Closterium sp. Naga37s-1]|nr:unnamed protein product [Closterium sp. Naga37s-1]